MLDLDLSFTFPEAAKLMVLKQSVNELTEHQAKEMLKDLLQQMMVKDKVLTQFMRQEVQGELGKGI